VAERLRDNDPLDARAKRLHRQPLGMDQPILENRAAAQKDGSLGGHVI
jgi:hypothetical protein